MAVKKDKIFRQADKYLSRGQIERAIGEYQKIVKEEPNDWTTINRIGDLYKRIGKTGPANECYQKIAHHFAEEGFVLKAIAMYKKIAKLSPGNIEVFEKLADLYAQQGLMNDARQNFQMVADIYMKEGNSQQALEIYSKISEIDPDNLKIRLTLADLYLKEEKHKEALKEYRVIGEALAKKGMVEESIRVFEKALALDANNIDIIKGLSATYAELGEHEKGLSFLEEHARKFPDDLDVQTLLAENIKGAGKIEEAEEAFKKILEKDPGKLDAVVHLFKLALERKNADEAYRYSLRLIAPLQQSNRLEQAVSYLEELLKVDPVHIESLEKLAELHDGLGSNEKVRCSVLTRLAEAYAEGGKFEDAAAILEKVIDLEPDNAQHKDKLNFVRSKLAEAGEEAEVSMEMEEEENVDVAEIQEDLSLEVPDVPEGTEAMEAAPEEEREEIGELSLELSPEGEEEEGEAAGSGTAAAVEEPVTEPEIADEESIDETFVYEHSTEAEVFVKYGLIDKAIEQLREVLKKYPDHLETHTKLKNLYKEEGQSERAVAECLKMVNICRSRGDEASADDLLDEAMAIDPNNKLLKMVLDGEAIPESELASVLAEPVEEELSLDNGEDLSAGEGQENNSGSFEAVGGDHMAGLGIEGVENVDVPEAEEESEVDIEVEAEPEEDEMEIEIDDIDVDMEEEEAAPAEEAVSSGDSLESPYFISISLPASSLTADASSLTGVSTPVAIWKTWPHGPASSGFKDK